MNTPRASSDRNDYAIWMDPMYSRPKVVLCLQKLSKVVKRNGIRRAEFEETVELLECTGGFNLVSFSRW